MSPEKCLAALAGRMVYGGSVPDMGLLGDHARESHLVPQDKADKLARDALVRVGLMTTSDMGEKGE